MSALYGRAWQARADEIDMALSVITGQFAANTGSATTTVSSTFQGKAIILWTTGQTANGSDAAANAMFSIGFSDGTNHRCIAWASDDNVATTNVGKTLRTTAAVEILSNGTPTSVRTATGVSFGASSFDITWDGTPAAAYLVGYMLLGGSDITNVKVGTHTMANSTGDKTETGVGFEGDFGFFLFSFMTAAGTAVRANSSLGFVAKVNDSATSRARQFGMAWGIDDAQNMTTTIDAVSYTNNANFLSYILDGAETVDVLAQFGTSTVPLGFASDGFRYNISNAAATNAQLLPYLIIKGGQWDVGTVTLPASEPTDLTVTGISFQPQGLFLAGTAALLNATVETNANSTVGAATSTTTEVSGAGAQADAVLNTTVNRTTSSTRIIDLGAFYTGSADFKEFTSDGWTITTASICGEKSGWFAMASNAVVVPAEELYWQQFPITQSEPIITVF